MTEYMKYYNQALQRNLQIEDPKAFSDLLGYLTGKTAASTYVDNEFYSLKKSPEYRGKINPSEKLSSAISNYVQIKKPHTKERFDFKHKHEVPEFELLPLGDIRPYYEVNSPRWKELNVRLDYQTQAHKKEIASKQYKKDHQFMSESLAQRIYNLFRKKK
jgi:hypothetical protein